MVDSGNLAAVERFVEVGVSLNVTDTVTGLPETALQSALHIGRTEIMKFLIDKGVNVSAVDEGDSSVLWVAVGVFDAATVRYLVEAGHDMENTGFSRDSAARCGGVWYG